MASPSYLSLETSKKLNRRNSVLRLTKIIISCLINVLFVSFFVWCYIRGTCHNKFSSRVNKTHTGYILLEIQKQRAPGTLVKKEAVGRNSGL